jgi:hypothetical protein
LHRRTKKARKVLGGVAHRGGVDGRWRSTSRRLSGEGGMKVETPRDSPRHGGDHVRWATTVENRGAVAVLTGERGAARSAWRATPHWGRPLGPVHKEEWWPV